MMQQPQQPTKEANDLQANNVSISTTSLMATNDTLDKTEQQKAELRIREYLSQIARDKAITEEKNKSIKLKENEIKWLSEQLEIMKKLTADANQEASNRKVAEAREATLDKDINVVNKQFRQHQAEAEIARKKEADKAEEEEKKEVMQQQF